MIRRRKPLQRGKALRHGAKSGLRRRPRPDPEWEATKAEVRHRSGGICEVRLDGELGLLRCLATATDPHHVVKRSKGGKKTKAKRNNPNMVVDICRAHHEMTDWSYAKGRLVIIPEGDGFFAFRIVTARDKYEARASLLG